MVWSLGWSFWIFWWFGLSWSPAISLRRAISMFCWWFSSLSEPISWWIPRNSVFLKHLQWFQFNKIDTRKRKKYTKPSFSSWFVALELSIEINRIQQRSTARGIEFHERRVSFILLLRLSRQQLTKPKSFLTFDFESSNISDWSATEILPCFPDYRFWLVNWTEKMEAASFCYLAEITKVNNKKKHKIHWRTHGVIKFQW